MGFWERKKAIKLSADLAMASTRKQTTCWSRALLVNASREDENKVLTEQILGLTQCQRLRKLAFTNSSLFCNNRRMIIRSSKILKRSRTVRIKKKSLAQKVMAADSIAKRLVQKKTRMLKSLLPGGKFMDDEATLIKEALDYIESLRAQVEVMRCLVTASELINHP